MSARLPPKTYNPDYVSDTTYARYIMCCILAYMMLELCLWYTTILPIRLCVYSWHWRSQKKNFGGASHPFSRSWERTHFP